MKKIELFGLSLTFKINRKNPDDAELYTNESNLREKIVYLMTVILIIVMSSKAGYITSSQKYEVGDVVTKDIYAPKSILYNDKDKKNEIIKKIVADSEKQYIYVQSAGETYISTAEYFFDEMSKKDNKKSKLYLENVEAVIGQKIPEETLKELHSLKSKEFNKVRENIIGFLKEAYKLGIRKENNEIEFDEESREKYLDFSSLERDLIKKFIVANYIYDEVKTKEAIVEKIAQIDDQIIPIQAGQVLAEKGEIITEGKANLLQAAGIYSYDKSLRVSLANLLYTSILIGIFYPILSERFKKYILNKNIYRSLFLIITGIFLVYRLTELDHIYFIPFETMFFLMIVLFKREFSMTIVMMIIFFLLPLVGYDLVFILVTSLVCIMGGYLREKVKTRQDLIALGMKMAVIKFFMYLLISYFIGKDKTLMGLQASEIIVSGLLSGMFTIAILPYFERTFNILTTFRLLELGDLSHPLLKMLSVKAPGTFHHSMMVATLSEAAAEAIGANAILARVASYYHDIGKMKRPKFYVENQEGGENPHSKISPFLSTLIITAHTKDGCELGKEYKIPKEIRDIMLEHQGTTVLAYFYNKAKQLDSSVTEDDFRYGGPIPKSKESAIIMLADSIEAAVRSLDEKTPITIENMLRKIINRKIEENQLSEAALTFQEIEVIIKTFTKVLMSIHHVRIKYPGQK